jgi:fumarate reductase subunit C
VEVWLFVIQRLSAMILAPLVIVHLVTMIYAIQGGLSAEEIMSRTNGSAFWGTLYGLFVVAAAMHGAIGLRQIVRETVRWQGTWANLTASVFCAIVLWLGYRAVTVLL